MTRPILLLLLLACGCASDEAPTDSPPPGTAGGTPCLAVEPELLTFGRVTLGDPPAERVIQVRNDCTGTLEISTPSVDAPERGFSLADTDPSSLGPGASTELTARFAPREPGQVEAEVAVYTNAGRRTVRVRGTGRGPRITVEPEAIGFGEQPLGCPTERSLRVENRGNELLRMTGLTLDGSPDLTLPETPSVPRTLSPDGSPLVLDIGFAPTSTEPTSAVLTLQSDDPLQPILEIDMAGTGQVGPQRTDTFERAGAPLPDIVFTVDRSGFMPDKLPPILDASESFFERLQENGADPHVAVIVADDSCPVLPVAFIDRSSSAEDAASIFTSLVDVDFSKGSAGLDHERAFLLVERALAQTGEGECLEGLLRADASLATVHISDEPEQTDTTWWAYVDQLVEVTGDKERVTVSAIAGDYPSGCLDASAGRGFYEASIATGGGFYSICDPDMDTIFTKLADDVTQPRTSFRLAHEPLLDTLEVRVDGVVQTAGWAYLEEARAVRFEPEHLPGEAATVELTYVERLACR